MVEDKCRTCFECESVSCSTRSRSCSRPMSTHNPFRRHLARHSSETLHHLPMSAHPRALWRQGRGAPAPRPAASCWATLGARRSAPRWREHQPCGRPTHVAVWAPPASHVMTALRGSLAGPPPPPGARREQSQGAAKRCAVRCRTRWAALLSILLFASCSFVARFVALPAGAATCALWHKLSINPVN